jgi:hypothetical protein
MYDSDVSIAAKLPIHVSNERQPPSGLAKAAG